MVASSVDIVDVEKPWPMWLDQPRRARLALQSSNEFDLDSNIKWQFRHANCTPGVSASVSENLYQKIGTAVNNSGHLVEARRGVNHSEHLEKSINSVDIAQCVLQSGQDV